MTEKPELQIVGHHGNAYAIIGKARKTLRYHLRSRGFNNEQIDEKVRLMQKELSAGDYDNLLRKLHDYFDVC